MAYTGEMWFPEIFSAPRSLAGVEELHSLPSSCKRQGGGRKGPHQNHKQFQIIRKLRLICQT